MGNMINLEPLCAQYGMEIVDKYRDSSGDITNCENIINKSLGILIENGFYAMHVFLLSCKPSKIGFDINEVLLKFLASKQLHLVPSGKKGVEALKDIRKITENLPQLILARRLTEQVLTFARYHCKALSSLSKTADAGHK